MEAQGQTEFLRLASEDRRPVSEVVADPSGITRAVVLNVPVTVECVARMPALREAVFLPEPINEVGDAMATAGVRTCMQPVRALGTERRRVRPRAHSCGLRRILQLHHRHREQPAALDHAPPSAALKGRCGQQFGDDPNFANGTVEGKRTALARATSPAATPASSTP